MQTARPVAFLMALAVAAPALSQPALAPSHLLQNPEDHVVLVPYFHDYRYDELKCSDSLDHGPSTKALYRVLPDGRYDDERFRVPEGRLLVVTDVEWMSTGGPYDWWGLDPEIELVEAAVFATISIGNPSTYPPTIQVWRSPPVRTVGDRFNGGSSQLTTGFVVASGGSLCPIARWVIHAEGEGTYGATGTTQFSELIIRGYLIDAPPP